jgi:hypothetical protein
MGGVENVEKLMGESAEAMEYQRVSFPYFFFFSQEKIGMLTRWGMHRR